MTYIYIHYTASIVLANSFFWPEYPFKQIRDIDCRLWVCSGNLHAEDNILSRTWLALMSSNPCSLPANLDREHGMQAGSCCYRMWKKCEHRLYENACIGLILPQCQHRIADIEMFEFVYAVTGPNGRPKNWQSSTTYFQRFFGRLHRSVASSYFGPYH